MDKFTPSYPSTHEAASSSSSSSSSTIGVTHSQSQPSSSSSSTVGVTHSQSQPSVWCPNHLAFRPYSIQRATSLRVHVTRPLVTRLTKHIVETYQLCNPEFKYSQELNPKRFLTSPSDGVLNDGFDNSNSDLILSVNYLLLNSHSNRTYVVKDILGHGTFGQVAKCWVPQTNTFVAIKIIKNQPAYYQQAWVEVAILTTLNKKFDPEDKHHIVRIYDYFVFQRHLCISFELLDTNLYELIKINNFRGLSLSIVQLFSKQILRGLGLMKDAGIIHCDLKPENILLCTSVKPAEIKIIDFGSACMEDRTVYSYIQSRYYRSPEVLLGYQYTTAIDMWSFGCIVAELFLGLPLFPGASEFDLLRRMIRILGGQPPDYLLKGAKNTNKFFKFVGNVDHIDVGHLSVGGGTTYQVLTEEEYETREKKKPVIGKEYFNYMNLEGIVAAYPYRKNLPEEDINREKQVRLALIDFLRGLVEFDPAKRWSPFQASKHPFVTGEPFTSPYKPPLETPRVPVSQNFKVDHHPGGGHWFAAGLSPNVPGQTLPMHIGPHLHMASYAHGNSYGSLGSHNSYNDCNGLGSSYGSYGDNYNAFTYFSPVGPSAANLHAQGGMTIGTSPDGRWRMVNRTQGLGVSPSTGNLAPLPLGTSPSQFTPPSNFSHVSGSPGHYSSASPVRGSCQGQGSPLGKGVGGASHLSRRVNSGYSVNHHHHHHHQEGPSSSSSSSSRWHGQYVEGSTNLSQSEGSSQQVNATGQHHWSVSWMQPRGRSGDYNFPNMANSYTHGMGIQLSQGLVVAANDTLPDPADWDPNYSDELLLQEDSGEISEIASEFNKLVHIDQAISSPISANRSGKHNHDSNASFNTSVQRQSGPTQRYSKSELGNSTYALPSGYTHSISKPPLFQNQLSPTSPRRLGQPPIQHQPSHGRFSVIHGNDTSHMNLQQNSFSYNPANPHSPRGTSFSNTPWGRRTNPMANMPPSSRGRKDYGRIA